MEMNLTEQDYSETELTFQSNSSSCLHTYICFILKTIQWCLLTSCFVLSSSLAQYASWIYKKEPRFWYLQRLQYLYCTHPPLPTPPFIPRSSDMPESLGEAVGVSRQDDTPTSVLDSKPTREKLSLITCRHG